MGHWLPQSGVGIIYIKSTFHPRYLKNIACQLLVSRYSNVVIYGGPSTKPQGDYKYKPQWMFLNRADPL